MGDYCECSSRPLVVEFIPKVCPYCEKPFPLAEDLVMELEFLRKRVAELEGENARLKAELETEKNNHSATAHNWRIDVEDLEAIADDLEWLNCMFEIVQAYCME